MLNLKEHNTKFNDILIKSSHNGVNIIDFNYKVQNEAVLNTCWRDSSAKKIILSLFTHPHFALNLYDLISSVKHKNIFLKNAGNQTVLGSIDFCFMNNRQKVFYVPQKK